MTFNTRYWWIWLLVLQLLAACNDVPVGSQERKPAGFSELNSTSSRQLFSLALTTENGAPAPIGKYHNWTVLILDQQSNPVNPALISVTGGMPGHGHGLPTQPRVTEYLGNGRYKIEGMKFNMDGDWTLQVHVATETIRDVAEFNFNVTY